MSAIIYLIHGFVGAGKTTFSKKLEKDMNAVRYTPDEWMIERHGVNPPADKFDEYLVQIKNDILDDARKNILKGRSIIFDYGFWSYRDREKYRSFAKELGTPCVLYFLKTDDQISQERALKRTSAMPEGALVIDQNALNLFRARFEPLRMDEEHISIDNNEERDR